MRETLLALVGFTQRACELVPLFDLSQSTLPHHLDKLRIAGIEDSERKGLWGLLLHDPRRSKELSDMAELTAATETTLIRVTPTSTMSDSAPASGAVSASEMESRSYALAEDA